MPTHVVCVVSDHAVYSVTVLLLTTCILCLLKALGCVLTLPAQLPTVTLLFPCVNLFNHAAPVFAWSLNSPCAVLVAFAVFSQHARLQF